MCWERHQFGVLVRSLQSVHGLVACRLTAGKLLPDSGPLVWVQHEHELAVSRLQLLDVNLLAVSKAQNAEMVKRGRGVDGLDGAAQISVARWSSGSWH